MGVASVGDCLYLDLNSRQLSTAIDNCRQLPSTFIHRQKCSLTVDDFRQLSTFADHSR